VGDPQRVAFVPHDGGDRGQRHAVRAATAYHAVHLGERWLLTVPGATSRTVTIWSSVRFA
jgi:hypothetical protein